MDKYINFCKNYNLKINDAKSLSIYFSMKMLQNKLKQQAETIVIRGLK